MNNDLWTSLANDYSEAHSAFQIDHFIVGESGETLYGMYQQTLRELLARLQGARSEPMSIGHRTECARFLAIAITIKQQLGEISPERREKLDRDMWLARFKRMAALDLLCEYQITRGTWRVILNTPLSFRAELVDTMINRPQELKSWLLQSDSPRHLIEGKIDEEEALRLLGDGIDCIAVDATWNRNGATQTNRLTAARKD